MKKYIKRIILSLLILSMIFVPEFKIKAAEEVEDTTNNKANLVISNKELPLVSSGKQQNVTFIIKNIGNYSASHVKVTPDITKSGADKIRIAQQYLDPIDVTINTQKEQSFTLAVITDDGIEQGTYPIGLVVDYTNGWGDTFQQNILTYVNVMKDGNLSSTVNVTQQSVSNNKPKAGDSIDFNYTLKNVEAGTIKNLDVWISGLPSEQFALMGDKPKINIRELRSGRTNNVTFNYLISEKEAGGSYPYKLNYQYINTSGYLVKKEVDYNIYIAPNTAKGGAVEVKDLEYPGNINQDESFDVEFNLVNTGETELKNVKVKLAENAVFLPESTSVVSINSLGVGKSQNIKFKMVGTGDELKSRNYPITFNITYDTLENGVITPGTSDQTIGIYIVSKTDSGSGVGVPKIIVQNYLSDPLIISAGSEFDLHLTFANTHKEKAIQNIKAFLTVTEIGEETTGSVFTPVNSSNTFYIDYIQPKGSVDRNIRLYTIPDAIPKTYTITVKFEYEDTKGNPYTAEEFIGINVKQPTKVETSDMQLPTEIFAGQPQYIYFDIYNTGKVKVYNLMVKAEGNFMADPQSYYIGNFDSGTQDYYEGNITAYEPGNIEGKFIISYDDATGEHIEIIKDINLIVMGNMPMEPFPGDGMTDMPIEGEGKGLGIKGIIGIIVGIIVIVTSTIVILKKRKAKKEGMISDED